MNLSAFLLCMAAIVAVVSGIRKGIFACLLVDPPWNDTFGMIFMFLPLFSVFFLKAGGNRSRKSPPDSLFLGRTLGGCSLFGHSCLGGHGKRSSSSSPVTASVESRQQQVGGNMMNWPGEELSPSAAVAELRNSKNRQQILVIFFIYKF